MLKKIFGFDSGFNSVKVEIVAGLTTFLTMAYILAVNPDVFKALADQGMDNGAVFTATAIAATVGTLIMAIYAKKPFGLAPGMGLNTFFVYTVCLNMGYSWQFALTAIFLEGIIFIILTLTKVRTMIVEAIPDTLKKAISCGIGLYIAFIGLRNTGIIVSNPATSVGLGDFTDSSVLLAIFGILLTSALIIFKIKGSMLVAILITSLVGIPLGITHLTGVMSTPPSIEPIFFQFELGKIFSWDMLAIVCTFLFIDMFDTIGTIVGVSLKTKMVDKDGKVDKIDQIFMADAVATTVGACVGSSTTSTYIESAAGVEAGGRTGLTAFTIAVCFALSLFFAPLFLSIPTAATGPILVIVGIMMIDQIRDIDFADYSEGIPAFITMLFMPLAYSISDGIMLGTIFYVVLNLITKNGKKVNLFLAVLAILFLIHYISNILLIK